MVGGWIDGRMDESVGLDGREKVNRDEGERFL